MNTKQRLRNQADKLWKIKVIGTKTKCEVCNAEPVITGHHFFPKGMFGHLRYNVLNGVAIGVKCHFNHHHKGDPTIHAGIIEKRGMDWFDELSEISRQNPASYQTVGYYKEVIKKLI